MNTSPHEELLALWVEGELTGAEAAEVESWASRHPEWMERRELARRSRVVLAGGLGGGEEVPYPEFFQARVMREIERMGEFSSGGEVVEEVKVVRRVGGWWMPMTAVAGMALCFWVGRAGRGEAVVVVPDGGVRPVPMMVMEPVIYVPERGVKADYYLSEHADADVIVLSGVAAIPDSFEIPDTASLPKRGEEESTASSLNE